MSSRKTCTTRASPATAECQANIIRTKFCDDAEVNIPRRFIVFPMDPFFFQISIFKFRRLTDLRVEDWAAGVRDGEMSTIQ